MTLSTRAFVRGRYGDQPVYSRYAVGGGPDWMQGGPHEPLGLEDLDDVAQPIVATPSGGGGVAQPAVVSVGSKLGGGLGGSILSAVPALSSVVAQASGIATPAGGSSSRSSRGGAVARPVSADGSVNGDKGYYAEVINPEHPQYQAAQAALAKAAPQEVQQFAQNVQEGIRQAVTGQTATGWLGSILGAGIGGPGLGTGALPGILGQRAEALFGSAGLPPAAVWNQGALRPTSYINDPAWLSLANDVDRVGRTTAERVLGIAQPQLDGIRRLLEHRAAQVQATSEHRQAMSMQQTIAQVLELLQHIAIATGARRPIDFAINAYAANGGAWRRY